MRHREQKDELYALKVMKKSVIVAQRQQTNVLNEKAALKQVGWSVVASRVVLWGVRCGVGVPSRMLHPIMHAVVCTLLLYMHTCTTASHFSVRRRTTRLCCGWWAR